MKKTLLITALITLCIAGCGREPEPPQDHFDKKVQCEDIGKTYVADATVWFYGYNEELNTCIGATIKQYDTTIDYDIYDILEKESLYTCTYNIPSPSGTNNCNNEFFELVDNKYKLR